MYLNNYNYTKSLFGRNIEIFSDETKWGYISWSSLISSKAIGDLYGKKYHLSTSSHFPFKVTVRNEAGDQELATLKFNLWCTKANLQIHNSDANYKLKSKHHFISKYIWYKETTEVMRISNGFTEGKIESSVTEEEHNAIMVVSALYINNHLVSTIILLLIVAYFIFE